MTSNERDTSPKNMMMDAGLEGSRHGPVRHTAKELTTMLHPITKGLAIAWLLSLFTFASSNDFRVTEASPNAETTRFFGK